MTTKARILIAVAVIVIAGIAIAVIGKLIQTHKSEDVAVNDPVTSIEIASSGSISLTDSSQVSIKRKETFVGRKPSSNESIKDSVLKITAKCPRFHFGPCSVGYQLGVPASVPVKVVSKGGSVSAKSVKSDMHVTSTSGSLSFDNTYGLLDVSTKSGSVNATAISSRDITAKTDSGAIQFKFAATPTSVNTQSKSGAVRVTLPKTSTSFAVDASSQSGKTTINVPRDGNSPFVIAARSDSGDVTVEAK